MKKITIITATYNSIATVARCMESVAIQSSLDQIEHIVVDGGSTDNTLDVVSRFPHVAKVISEADNGIYDAFNKGLNLATGEFIYYLNSDDHLLNPEVMAIVINTITSEGLDYLSCLVQEKNPVTGATSTPAPIELLFNNKMIQKPCHQGFFVRTSLLKKLGGFPRCFEIVADTYIMLSVIISAKGRFIDMPVACFTLDGVSSDSNNMALITKELSSVYSLLDLQQSHNRDDYTLQLRQTLTNLKHLFVQSFDKPLNSAIANGRITLFGTGEMSVIISKIMQNQGVKIENYMVTKPTDEYFLNRAVVDISTKIESDVVINTIEGQHFSDITAKIKHYNPHVVVLRWDKLYEQ